MTVVAAQIPLSSPSSSARSNRQVIVLPPSPPDYSWIRLIKASDPTFSCGRSPVSLKSSVDSTKSIPKQDNWTRHQPSNGHFGRLPPTGGWCGDRNPPLRTLPRARFSRRSLSRCPELPFQTPPQPLPVRRRLTDQEDQSPPLAHHPGRHSQHPFLKSTQTPPGLGNRLRHGGFREEVSHVKFQPMPIRRLYYRHPHEV